jgi:hypothetical protein
MNAHSAALRRKIVLPVCILSWIILSPFTGFNIASGEQLVDRSDPSAGGTSVADTELLTTEPVLTFSVAATPSLREPKRNIAAASAGPQAVPPEAGPQRAPQLDVVTREPEDGHSAGLPDDAVRCLSDECIDQYLWSLYQRAPKLDAAKVQERIKLRVKRRGRSATVVRTFIKIREEDFSWKDPKAAEKVGMQLSQYVIGGVNREFKQKLFHMSRAAELAGFSIGITSAFRDDYRQSIASGYKAANNRSYHGGSLRGGYGHGLAVDLVSVDGATRSQRLASSRLLWIWIDANGQKFGIGRPYRDKDPPHAAPMDGKEYADHRPYEKKPIDAASKPGYELAVRDSRKSP